MTNAERMRLRRARVARRPCAVEGCPLPRDRASGAKHVCAAHFQRWRRTGSFQEEVPVRSYQWANQGPAAP